MKLSQTCVRRPVLTIVITLLPILIGLVLFKQTPVTFAPRLGSKTITISITASQLGASELNQQVIRPILSSLGTVKGVQHTYATASNTKGSIMLLLPHDADLDDIITQTNNQLASIRDTLPPGISTTVTKGSANWPQAALAASAPNMDEAHFYIYYKNYFVPLINHIVSVGSTNTLPGGYDNMIIALNPQAVNFYHLTIPDVLSQLNTAIVSMPVWGNAAGNLGKSAVYLNAELSTLNSLQELPIKLPAASSQHPVSIPLKDIAANIHMGKTISTSLDSAGPPIINFQPKPNSLISLIYQSDDKNSNLLDLSQQLHALTMQSMSDGIKTSILLDLSTYLHKVINGVALAISIAFILVAIIIYSFLGKITTAIIPMVTVPTCLISSSIIIYLLGFSLNIFTLLALLLAVGLVVDDAIVLIECVDKNLETQNSPKKATLDALKQIAFPLISMSLTLAAVYVPMAFTTSVMGPALQQFSIVLAGSVLISAFVALTLTPMMAARMMSSSHSKLSLIVNSVLNKIINLYSILLRSVLSLRWLFLIIVIGIIISGYFAIKNIPGGLVTQEDSGLLMAQATFHGLSITGDFLKKQFNIFNQALKPFKPEIKRIMTIADSGSGIAFITLKEHETSAVVPKMKKALTAVLKYPQVTILNPVSPSSIFRESTNSINFIIQSPKGQDLVTTGHSLIKSLDKYKQISTVQVAADLPGEGLQSFIVNSQLAKQYGVDESKIHDIVQTTMGTALLNQQLIMPNYNPNVYVQLPNAYFDSPEKLYGMHVRNHKGQFISLRSLGEFKFVWKPNKFITWDNINANTITVNFKHDNYIQGIKFLNSVLPQTLPQGITYTYVGQAGTYLQDQQSQMFLFMAAFIFIYLILSAQFESFKDAFIIIFSLPVTISLTLWAIFVVKIDFNIYTQIGLLTLIGLTCKNGILITEFANQLCAEGKDKLTAVIDASKLRFRPILMTSLAMVMGSIPLILADEAIKHMMFDVGYVILTGMILGTISSLFTVPLIYHFIKRDKHKAIITISTPTSQ